MPNNRRKKMNHEYDSQTDGTVGDLRSATKSKEQMKKDWGPQGGNNRRIKPKTTWAKKITPKGH